MDPLCKIGFSVERSQFGVTIITHFLDLWKGPASHSTMTILLRAAATNEDAAAKMRKIFTGQVMPMLSKISDRTETATRAGLVSSQLLGIALSRYVLKYPAMVGMKPEQIIKNFGPTLQRYMAEPL